MYISLNWIKDYVDLSKINKDEIIKRFVLSTAEIESVIEKGQDISGVVFAKIVKVENHPNSQKLHVLQVDKGDEIVQIVCGAPNVREGMVTALATMGGKVCGHKISKAKLAGIESFGMCCAESELGIGSDDNGIMDIKDNVIIGQDIKELWPIEDTIIEIDNKSLTNRPDLWGHYGIARELATIFRLPLKNLDVDDLSKYNQKNKLSINIEDKNCYRYSAITVGNITKKVSPIIMKIRLNYVGQRDINLLADLTNYLMLDVGQPMHAFDNKKVKGINVISAKEGDKLLTLEGEKHDIPQNSVLICNENKEPVAIAGVKGGMLSSISEDTNSLLLESATFDSTSIRRTSIAVGLRTDSSLRYEKSLDPELTTTAIARFIKILKDIDKNIEITSALTDVYNYKYPKIEISFDTDFITRRVGVKIPESEIVTILNYLGFKTTKVGDNEFKVLVPSFRATKDVSIKEDLVEEIARMYGYDNIKPENILTKNNPIQQDKEIVCEYQTKVLLADKFGLNEVHSYIWNYADFNKEYKIESSSYVNLLDSSNSGQSGIRSQMVPTLLKIFAENKNNYNDVNIFEIGRVVAGLENNHAIEEKHLAIVCASTTLSEKELYFKLKKMVENICSTVVITKVNYITEGARPNYYHPVNSCLIENNDNILGMMGLLHPAIIIDKKFKIAILELDFSKLCACEETINIVKEVSKYQAVNLDFNFVADKNICYSQIEKLLNNFRAKLNVSYALKDIYENESVLPGKRSYTFAYTIVSKDHTLTSEEIDKFSNRLIQHMKENGIELR